MNKARTVIFDKNGNMVRKTNYCSAESRVEKPNETLNSELQLVRVGWQNSGAYFELRDADGHEYYMSHGEFQKYLDQHKVILQDDFTYYKQGTIQSIGIDR